MAEERAPYVVTGGKRVTSRDRVASIAALATHLLAIIDAGDKSEHSLNLNERDAALECAEDIFHSILTYVEFKKVGAD
jgi:hypothetical protein